MELDRTRKQLLRHHIKRKLVRLSFSFTCLGLLILAGRVSGYEIGECLECHSNPKLSKGDEKGDLKSLFVDGELYKDSVHGRGEFTCEDCHEDATPDAHPAAGYPDVDCASCHDDVPEQYAVAPHGKAQAKGDSRVPKCYDCHTTHNVRPREDVLSSLHEDNLSTTCGACHEDIVAARGFFTGLFTFRIHGHEKVNLAGRYDETRCFGCHIEVRSHGGEEGAEPEQCYGCHRTSVARSGLLFSPVHKGLSWKEQPLSLIAGIFNGLAALAIVVGILVFFGQRSFGGSGTVDEKGKTEETQG
jgi:hypothetical protein